MTPTDPKKTKLPKKAGLPGDPTTDGPPPPPHKDGMKKAGLPGDPTTDAPPPPKKDGEN